MDFRNYIADNNSADARYRIKDTIDSLGKLSDGELFNELSKQVAIKKQNGTLGDIDKLLETIQPFLDAEQKKRLDMVIKNIKV
jgi:transcription termination factor NusB